MTLRELYMWLNPEYAQKWRMQQAQKLSPNPSYMDGGSLRDVFQQKQNMINSSPVWEQSPGNKGKTEQELYLIDMYSPPYKVPPRGML